MTTEERSIVANRMQTLVDLYSRNYTIDRLSKETGLSKKNISEVLKDNNFYHGIKRKEGTSNHPINLVVCFNNYDFLLNCPKLDLLRLGN